MFNDIPDVKTIADLQFKKKKNFKVAATAILHLGFQQIPPTFSQGTPSPEVL